MSRPTRIVVLLIGASVLLVTGARKAQAIPAYARHEGFSCQVCHFRMPELNETGREYLRRGLRMPGAETPAPRPLGQPLSLNLADYVSVMGDHGLAFQKGAEAEFQAGEIGLWVGGPFSPKWSALTNAAFDIEGGGTEVEQGYGHFITGGGDRFGSGRFGQILPFAVLLHQGGPPALSLSTPVVLDTPGDTGNSWTPATFLRGAEAGLASTPQWNAYLGLGQPHLEGSGERHTDVYASAERRFAAQQASLTGYGYWGKASLAEGDPDRDFHRIGVFADILRSNTLGALGYLTGSDEAADGRSLDSSGYFLLAEQLLSDRWVAYGRYDHLRRDLSAGGTETIRGPALGVSWWPETEVRLTAEAQFLNTTGEPDQRSLVLDLMWIF